MDDLINYHVMGYYIKLATNWFIIKLYHNTAHKPILKMKVSHFASMSFCSPEEFNKVINQTNGFRYSLSLIPFLASNQTHVM